MSCQSVTETGQGFCRQTAAVQQVAPGVYVRPGRAAVVFESDEVANVGFVIGERCVAVIDTGGSLAEGRALDCAIRELTTRPVCYVINTHVHPDHLLGNRAFAGPGVEFVGHSKLPRALALRGDVYLQRASEYEDREIDASAIVFPERTVTGRVQLDIGDRTLIVRAHNSAHTDHDVSVVDDKTNTVFLGDLVFLDHLPVIDGSINGWIDVLEDLNDEMMAQVVPGHGPVDVSWPEAAGPTLRYLRQLRQNVREWISSDGSLVEAQEYIGSFRKEGWLLFERYHRRNVGAAYAELEWEE